MKKYTILLALLITFFTSINISFAEETSSTGTTEQEEEVKQLKLNGVKVIGKKIVELEFASDIDESSDKDISIKEVGANGVEIFVKKYEINDKIVKLILEDELESNKTYEVIIFSIMGKDGSTITSGVDGALEFKTPDLSIFDKQEEETKETEEKDLAEVKNVDVQEDLTELNSAGLEEKTKTGVVEKNENLAGKEIKDEELKDNIEVVAAQKDKLAKTGPEDTLLIILALILAALIGYTLNQRKNNKI